MRKDKLKIFELRREGKSYREIQQIFPISRSTLTKWFENEEWSTHIKNSKIRTQKENQGEILAKMRSTRRLKLDEFYKNVDIEAKTEFELFKDNPLFIAGLMLYAGEGDKNTRHLSRLANTNFDLHRIFLNFIRQYLDETMENIRISLLLYPDLDLNECVSKWAQELGVSTKNFHKPIFINGKHKTKRLHFGVGSTILISTSKKRKLLLWLELSKKELAMRP